MNTIFADKLFENKQLLNSLDILNEKNLTLDFAKVKDFTINNLNALLDLQKIAVFNNVRLTIKNTTTQIDKILNETGLYRSLTGKTTNPILSEKRFNFS